MTKKDDDINKMEWGKKTSNQPERDVASSLTPRAVGINVDADKILMEGIGTLELVQLGYSEAEAHELVKNKVKSQRDFKRVFNKGYLLHLSPRLHKELKVVAASNGSTMRSKVIQYLIDGILREHPHVSLDFEQEMLTRTDG